MVNSLLPVFLDLEGALVVVTGTTQRAQDFAARCESLGASVRRVESAPAASHLEGASLLAAGSADAAEDRAALDAARARGLLAIALDGSGPAFLGESSGGARVALAATSRGASPELERVIVAAAASAIRPEHARLAEILASIRGKLEERFPDEADRAALWEQILDGPVMVLLSSGHDAEAVEMAERMAWGTG